MEFYKLIGEKQSIFGDSIFELIDIDNSGTLDFSEFVTAVGTFCMFGKIDILKFCFFIFDKDKNGYIEEDELSCLIDVLQGADGGYSNTKQALLGAFDGDGDGKMSFPEFCELHAKYPQMLHPAFRIQDSIANNTMGRDWWSKKKDYFHKGREKEKSDKAKEKQAFLDAQVSRQKRQIKRKMGTVNYYLNCAARRRYIAQIVVVDPEEEEAKKQAAMLEAQKKQATEQARAFKAKQAKESGDWTVKGKKQKSTIKNSSTSTKEGRAERRERRRQKMGGGGGGGRSGDSSSRRSKGPKSPGERPSKRRKAGR
jgi:Ca2+-binding EF-hand superfamily protein